MEECSYFVNAPRTLLWVLRTIFHWLCVMFALPICSAELASQVVTHNRLKTHFPSVPICMHYGPSASVFGYYLLCAGTEYFFTSVVLPFTPLYLEMHA